MRYRLELPRGLRRAAPAAAQRREGAGSAEREQRQRARLWHWLGARRRRLLVGRRQRGVDLQEILATISANAPVRVDGDQVRGRAVADAAQIRHAGRNGWTAGELTVGRAEIVDGSAAARGGEDTVEQLVEH